MFRILRGTIRVRELVFKAEQVVQKVRVHERAETELMDDPDGHILSLASDYGKVVSSLIQKNARHTHTLPQAYALFELPGSERYFFFLRRWDLTQADVAIKTRPGPAIPDGRDYPEGLLVLVWVPGRIAPGLFVRELQAIAQDHHVVSAEHPGCFLYISVGPIYQTGIAVIDCQARGSGSNGSSGHDIPTEEQT